MLLVSTKNTVGVLVTFSVSVPDKYPDKGNMGINGYGISQFENIVHQDRGVLDRERGHSLQQIPDQETRSNKHSAWFIIF